MFLALHCSKQMLYGQVISAIPGPEWAHVDKAAEFPAQVRIVFPFILFVHAAIRSKSISWDARWQCVPKAAAISDVRLQWDHVFVLHPVIAKPSALRCSMSN